VKRTYTSKLSNMRGVPKEKAGIQDSGLVDHEMVAGARNHPNCLVLPFRLGLIRLAA
jgi:hypothetical protein